MCWGLLIIKYFGQIAISCYYIQNTSIIEITNQYSNKEAHLQIIKIEMYRQTDGQTDRLEVWWK